MSSKSGDACPSCRKARLYVRTSRDTGSYYEQRLECRNCGHKETAYVHASTVRTRKPL